MYVAVKYIEVDRESLTSVGNKKVLNRSRDLCFVRDMAGYVLCFVVQ